MNYKPDQNIRIKGGGDPSKIRVLLYHRVRGINEGKNAGDKAVDEKIFQKHIELLDRKGFVSLTFEDYLLYLNGKLNLPKKGVIITFDDGFEEIYTIAFPIMKKYGMRGVVFMVAEPSAYDRVCVNGGDSFNHLNPNQVLELHASGFEIGSHTLTHQNLTAILKENAWHEIVHSRILLEILLNSKVKALSYPYGSVDKDIKKMVPAAGYEIACADCSAPPSFGADLFEIHRTRVVNSYPFFYIQLNYIYPFYKWFICRMKKHFHKSGKNGIKVEMSSN
jgi:peptidoglycan/xylan/chitin deacetylase (PgdA/CDA1 family)